MQVEQGGAGGDAVLGVAEGAAVGEGQRLVGAG